MRTRRLCAIAGCGLALVVAHVQNGCIGGLTEFEFEPLAFPIGDPGTVARIAAFGIPNWSGSEAHNGIDLVIDERLESARVVSPTAGIVSGISVNENPFSNPVGQLLVTIAIWINGEWTVNLVLEPSTVDPALRDAQLSAIMVSDGQTVEAGTAVADLLVGTLGYPHLHYMVLRNGEAACAYAHSSEGARAEFEGLSALANSNVPDGNICFAEP